MGFDKAEFDSLDGSKLIESSMPYEGYLLKFTVGKTVLIAHPAQQLKIDGEWRPAINIGIGQKATVLSDKDREILLEIGSVEIVKFRGRLKFIKNKEYLANGIIVRNLQ
jgi:hypothetical protein